MSVERVLLAVSLCGLLWGCGSEAVQAPEAARVSPERAMLGAEVLDGLSCGEALDGEVEASDPALEALGVGRYAYRLDVEGGAMQVMALSPSGAPVASLEAEIWLESGLVGRSLVVLRDEAGQERLRERGRAALEPGFGWRLDTAREVEGARVEVRALLSSEPAANRLTVAVPASEGAAGAVPGAQGPEVLFEVLDEEGALPADGGEALSAWARAQGAEAALEGRWDRLKAAVLEDEALRERLFAHIGWCGLDEEGKAQARLVASGTLAPAATQKPAGALRTQAQALTCAEEEWAKESSENLTATLDFVSTHAGKLALGGPLSYLWDNSGDLGLKLTIDAGEYGSVTLTKGDLDTIRNYAGGVIFAGAAGVALANPLGLALAGVSAGTYIAARVNEAFGEEALRDWLESRKQPRRRTPPRPVALKSWVGVGGSTGDPHLTTLDGLSYDFQASGEFWLLRTTRGEALWVQARQVPVGVERCLGAVSVNAAVAALVSGHRIEVRGDEEERFWLDGAPVEARALLLPGGGELAQEGGVLVIRSKEGDVLRLSRRGARFTCWWRCRRRARARWRGCWVTLTGTGATIWPTRAVRSSRGLWRRRCSMGPSLRRGGCVTPRRGCLCTLKARAPSAGMSRTRRCRGWAWGRSRRRRGRRRRRPAGRRASRMRWCWRSARWTSIARGTRGSRWSTPSGARRWRSWRWAERAGRPCFFSPGRCLEISVRGYGRSLWMVGRRAIRRTATRAS